MIPFDFRANKGYQYMLLGLYLLMNGLMLALEVPDIVYYKFAQRRSGVGEFNLAGDFVRLLPGFIKDYWYLWILLISLIWLMWFLYKRAYWKDLKRKMSFKYQLLIFLFTIGLSLIGARGGLQLRPITPVGAGLQLKDSRLIPLATNTSINFVFSFQQKALKEDNFFSDKQLDSLFTLKRNVSNGQAFRPMNVVVLIIESLSTEYTLEQHDGKIYTPFFDSLSQHSLHFERSYANAQRSAQGIVAITSGLPALMEEPFQFSPYQSNQVEGIASCLKKKGYTSGFFHGSNPGSMDFERFAAITGYDNFYDKTKFNNDELYDGNWGIWDIPFFQWTLAQLDKYPKPFFCTMFSLTSHSPFHVEKWFEKQYPNEDPMLRSVRYTDEALRRFFKTASTMDWYNNTLFVISADHTGLTINDNFKNKEGLFRIPIIFYCPDSNVISRAMSNEANKSVMSQIDIFPTILDFLNFNQDFHCFGKSILDKTHKYTYQYNNGIYQILDGEYILLFDGANVVGMYDYRNDPLLRRDIKLEHDSKTKELSDNLKAVVQRYKRAMIRNELNK